VFDYLNGMEMKNFSYPEHDDAAHDGEVSTLIYR
jgi:hypothetical protein